MITIIATYIHALSDSMKVTLHTALQNKHDTLKHITDLEYMKLKTYIADEMNWTVFNNIAECSIIPTNYPQLCRNHFEELATEFGVEINLNKIKAKFSFKLQDFNYSILSEYDHIFALTAVDITDWQLLKLLAAPEPSASLRDKLHTSRDTALLGMINSLKTDYNAIKRHLENVQNWQRFGTSFECDLTDFAYIGTYHYVLNCRKLSEMLANELSIEVENTIDEYGDRSISYHYITGSDVNTQLTRALCDRYYREIVEFNNTKKNTIQKIKEFISNTNNWKFTNGDFNCEISNLPIMWNKYIESTDAKQIATDFDIKLAQFYPNLTFTHNINTSLEPAPEPQTQ